MTVQDNNVDQLHPVKILVYEIYKCKSSFILPVWNASEFEAKIAYCHNLAFFSLYIILIANQNKMFKWKSVKNSPKIRIFDLQIYKEWTRGAESLELSTQRNNQVINSFRLSYGLVKGCRKKVIILVALPLRGGRGR